MKRFALKRITALVLALIMTLSLCPVSAFAAFAGDTWEPPEINGVTIYGGSNPSSGSDPGSVGYQLPYYYDGITIENNTVYVPSRPNQAKTVWLLSTKTLAVDLNNSEGATLTPCADPTTAWGEPVYCLVMPAKDSGPHSVDVTVTDTDGSTTSIPFTFGFEGVYFNDSYFYTAVDSQGYFTFNNRGTCDDMWFERTVDGDNQYFSFNVPFVVGEEKTLYIRPARGDIASMAVTGGSLYDSEVADPTTDFYDFASCNNANYNQSYKLTLTTNVTGNGSIYVTYYDGSGKAVDGADIRFTAKAGSQGGSSNIFSRGVFVFTDNDGNNLSCDNSVVQFGNGTDEYVYVTCGDITSRTVYLAVNQWDTLSVSGGVALSKVGQWNTTVDGNAWTCDVYEMTVPGNSNIAEYTVTRSWTYQDGSSDNEYFTLKFDFYPTITGTLRNAERGVAIFTKLDNTTLGYDSNVSGGQNGATVNAAGLTTQTMYLAVGVHDKVIVNDGTKDIALTRVGTWTDTDGMMSGTWAYEVYTFDVAGNGGVVEYAVTRTGFDGGNREDFTLTVDFSPVFTNDENSLIGARGVFLFTEKNGTEFSCDASSVAQWGDPSGEYLYLTCGDVASRTVYLAVNQWDALSVSGFATLPKVGTWVATFTDGNGDPFQQTCNVYEVTVPKPVNGKTVDYTVTRSWTWHDDGGTAHDESEHFTLTFDFAPALSGNIEMGASNIVFFTDLNGNELSCDTSSAAQWGTADGEYVYFAYGDTDDAQTMYLATSPRDTIAVKNGAANVPYTHVGNATFKADDGSDWLCKVYEVPVPAPASDKTVEYTVEHEWIYWENDQPVSQKEDIFFTFDFAPELTGELHNAERGVLLFTNLNNTTLGYDEDVLYIDGIDGAAGITILDKTSQTMYLGFAVHDEFTVENDGKSVDMTYVGLWSDPDWDNSLYRIYEVEVDKPADGSPVVYDVTNAWWNWENGVPSKHEEQVPLTVEFTTEYTDSGNGFAGVYGVRLFTEKNNTVLNCDNAVVYTWEDSNGVYANVTCGDIPSRTVYLAVEQWAELTVQQGQGTAFTPAKVGVWKEPAYNSTTDSTFEVNCNVYELTVVKPTTGNTVEYTVTRSLTWYDDEDNRHDESEDFTLTFDFSPIFTNSGNVQGTMGVFAFTGKVGNDLTCDNSVLTWGNDIEQHMYIACDDVGSRTIYLAVNQWDNLSVNGVGISALPKAGTWVGTFLDENNEEFEMTCNVYELTVDKPTTGNIVEYTVTRSWTWYDDEDKRHDESEDFTLTLDFAPVLTGTLRNMECGVAIFSKLENEVLGYDAQVNGYGGRAEVLALGKDSQTVYLASFADCELTVSDNAALKQVGVWHMESGNGRIFPAKVYEMTVKKPATNVATYTVKSAYAPDDYGTFDLTFDFSPLLTGEIVWGNWDVAIFTEKDGTELTCKDPIAQWWDTLYVAGGNVASKTVYLTIASYSDFTLTPQNGGTTIHKSDMELVGKWEDEWGNLKDVYALTVQNPNNDSKTVSYDAKRSWTWYDEANDKFVNQEMNFVLTFDFAPMLDGEWYNGTGGVGFFSSLKDKTLRGDNSLVSLGNSQMVTCGGADEKTIYMAVYANSDLSVSEYSTLNDVSIERVGTWTTTNDEGGFKNPFKVYALTVKDPGLDMNSVASFFVNREWEYYDDKGTYDDASDDVIIPYKDSFPLNFDFYLRPGVEVPPLMFNGLRIYGICEDGQLGYQHMYEYDEMAYNPTMNLVQVPGRPNHDHSIYLVSAKALTLKENTVGATLSVYKEASVVDGYTVYCLTMPAKNAGQFAVKVSDGTNDTTFNFWFDSVSYQRTSFYTTSNLNYENRLTCDGLSIEWLETGDPNEDHFYLKVPYAAGKAKDLYIVPNDADISSVEVYGGSWSETCTLEKHPSANVYKLSVPASSETGNVVLRFYKLDNEGNPFVFGAVDFVFEPQMEVKVDDTSVGEAEQAVGEVIADNIDEAITDGSVEIADEYEKEEIVQLQKDNKLELVPEQAMGCDEKDKKHIDEAVEKAGGTVSGTTIQYFDITVVLKHKDSGKTVAQVTDTKKDITITIELSPEMQRAARNGKIIRVLRVHNGVAEFLEAVLNAEKTMISFASSEFSSYALMATGVTVSGTVNSHLSTTDLVTIELFAEGSDTVAYSTTVTGNEATYTLGDVAAGTYTMKVSKANHVTRAYTVTVGDTDVTQDAKIHPKGDISGDGKVTINDVNKANLHYKKKATLTEYECLCADVSGDGSVTINDVNKLNLHYKNKSLLW